MVAQCVHVKCSTTKPLYNATTEEGEGGLSHSVVNSDVSFNTKWSISFLWRSNNKCNFFSQIISNRSISVPAGTRRCMDFVWTLYGRHLKVLTFFNVHTTSFQCHVLAGLNSICDVRYWLAESYLYIEKFNSQTGKKDHVFFIIHTFVFNVVMSFRRQVMAGIHTWKEKETTTRLTYQTFLFST